MKYAFVTGSTKGIGRSIGLQLLQEGYFVLFNSSTMQSSDKLKEELSDEYQGCYDVLVADMSNSEEVENIAAQITQITPKLDVLVFNTGLTDRSKFGEVKLDDWKRVFDANVNVPFFLMQSLIPVMNQSGNVIFIGSMLGNIPHSVSVSYGVSKASIHALVQNMVKFLSKDSIRINAIAPGFVDTEWQKEKPEWLREKIKGKVALNRFAEPDEVANLCLHIIENQYLTGQIIQMDGGYCCE